MTAPYSPERLWALSEDPIANRVPAGLDALEATVIDRCKVLMQQPHLVRGRVHFLWWPPKDAS